jgi:8-oxo-dGTP pyrophosphatase MutT (NUDIX family)
MRNRIRKLLVEIDFSEYDNDSGEPFWGNIGAGVLAFCTETERFLLDHRSEYVNEPHTFNVYGGKVDERVEEDLEQTVRREFEEETGYMGRIKLISLHVFRTKGFEYHNFLGLIEHEFKPINSWESQGHVWVTWEELLAIPNKHFGLSHLLSKDSKKIFQLTSNF